MSERSDVKLLGEQIVSLHQGECREQRFALPPEIGSQSAVESENRSQAFRPCLEDNLPRREFRPSQFGETVRFYLIPKSGCLVGFSG